MTDWGLRMYELAQHVATWSKDPSTKVGAVIFNYDHQVLGIGYNGFPRYVEDMPARYETKPIKYKLIVHAEANAILNAIGNVRGHCLVTTKYPCSECTKLIIQSGISRIITPKPTEGSLWAEDAVFSRVMLKEASVFVQELSL